MIYYLIQIDENEGFYTYLDVKGQYSVGEQVIINFAGRKKTGLIVAKDSRTEFAYEVKPIIDRAEGQIKISPNLMKLFFWMKEYYLCSFRDILNASYPQNLKVKYKKLCSLNDNFNKITLEDDRLIDYLRKKPISYETTAKNFGKELIDKHISLKNIVLTREPVFKKKSFKKDDENLEVNENKVTLNDEQENAKDKFLEGDKRFYLLKGVTGSGKTEVYLSIIREALKKGEGVIFLLPEIALTPQMIDKFKNAFNENLAILHSKLTPVQRETEWMSIYTEEKNIVLGVRSAIFAPVKNLKYIIIDEEHESSYKQDSDPRYDARYVALKRAEIENAKVLMGSATPLVESYFYAKNGIFELLELNKRYNENALPKFKLVNMREEGKGELSETLLEETAKRLRKGEQILYLLNRKGYSTYIQCEDCGTVETCPHCSVSLNYYKSDGRYRCNYCGYTKRFTPVCGSCKSDKLRLLGQGTEKLEDSVLEKFPKARVMRADAHTVKERDAYEKLYFDFLAKKYDILLGTQMISKGLHFPEVTLVGIINADTILHFPDFRSAEKTYQLVTQASGRAGRGEVEGEVVIQTYNPEHYVIEKIINEDYIGLYDIEIDNRKTLSYPPFTRIINIVLSSEDEKLLIQKSKEFKEIIKCDGVEIYGPIPCAIARIKNRFRYQIFVKGTRDKIRVFKKGLYEKIQKSKNNKLRITVDVDPINLL
ncbi:MAG: primosomal protein N' [Fusobacteriaceae bacterium]|nr:primosomal protein N' [Fusobacteriaceae bacterium]